MDPISELSGKPVTVTSVDTLCADRWLELRSMLMSDDTSYTFSHEVRCGGRIVAVLPYRRAGKDAWEIGVRQEITPCWAPFVGQELRPTLSSVTGGFDRGDSPVAAALRELREEAGYIVPLGALKPLGTCFGTKSCDTVYHLFAVDVTGLVPGEAPGDGSPRDKAPLVWTYLGGREIVDPLVYVMAVRADLL
jgi:8-oxo-dGTP pyrophosphatase MutT (NUDIX family)